LLEIVAPHWFPSEEITTTTFSERLIAKIGFLSIQRKATKPQNRLHELITPSGHYDIVPEDKHIFTKLTLATVLTHGRAGYRSEDDSLKFESETVTHAREFLEPHPSAVNLSELRAKIIQAVEPGGW